MSKASNTAKPGKTREPEAGQFWQSLDPRDDGLIVLVLRVEPTQIRIQRHRKTWVNRDRFPKQYRYVNRPWNTEWAAE